MTNKIKNSNLDADILSGATTLETVIASGDQILVYDSSAGVLRKITQTNFLNYPSVTSVSPTNLLSGDGTGNYTIVITGSGFTGGTASLINDSGTIISFDTVTVDSNTQITGVIAKSSLPGSGEPYDVRVTAASGLRSTLEDQINIDQQPAFSTAAGSLYSGSVDGYSNITIAAADPESGGDITYTLESGSLPAGLSGTSTSSGYVISGTPTTPGSDTTSNFTIRAADVNSNTSDRAFSITINAPVIESFTSSGTFSVPSGVTSVDVLVVAGGGGGGDRHAGGGGAGGLIFRPGFPVTPGGTVSVTVGDGGDGGVPGVLSPSGRGGQGQDSVFGTLTAKGGGWASPGTTGNPGGSGGGGGHGGPGCVGGSATQPTQPGDSGTYGFGNAGGDKIGSPGVQGGAGAGGGGAGAVGGQSCSPTNIGGDGGIGKAYTIADGTTSVYYAGGGGGSDHGPSPGQAGGPGFGGQGGGGRGGSVATCAPGPSGRTPYTGPNTGVANRGGGGGGGTRSENPLNGGAGGKGIVIVSY